LKWDARRFGIQRQRILALRGGVGQVRIASGAAPNVLERVLAGEAIGTRIVLEEAPA
jgi:acetylglutamate kinase